MTYTNLAPFFNGVKRARDELRALAETDRNRLEALGR